MSTMRSMVVLGLLSGCTEPDTETDDPHTGDTGVALTDLTDPTDPTDPTEPTDPTDPTDPDAFGCGAGGSLADPDTTHIVPGMVPAHMTRVDLGVHAAECGWSAPVTFEVPEGVESMQLVLVGHPGTVSFPASLVDPNGEVLIAFDARLPAAEDLPLGTFASLQLDSTNPVTAIGELSGTVVPNNDAVELVAGAYTVELGSWIQTIDGAEGLDSAVHAFVYFQQTDPQVGDRLVDVALHFSGTGGLTAAVASQAPDIAAALQVVNDTFAQVGVRIGRVTYHDLPPGYDVPFVLTDDGVAAVRAANIDGPVTSLNVLFFPNYEFPGYPGVGDTIAGLSLGLPGVPFARRDGVSMSQDRLSENATFGSHILVHEMGHFLGLSHTTQATGIHHDALESTPEGPSDNVMYFEVGAYTDPVLTEEQGRVLRRHGLVYPAN